MDQRPEDFQPARLSAQMASQRLLVLDFVRGYLERWGYSPSHGEIGAALDIDRSRVRRAVKSLVRGGLLIRTAATRGLAMPSDEDAALRQLRALGWVVNSDVQAIAKATLLPPAALDYPGPVADAGAKNGTSGIEAVRGRQGAGPNGD